MGAFIGNRPDGVQTTSVKFKFQKAYEKNRIKEKYYLRILKMSKLEESKKKFCDW